MLTLTDNAADIVKKLTDQVPDAKQPGLRISEAPADESSLALTPVGSPQPGDEIVAATGGAQVFLDSAAAALLGDKVLDAQLDDDGTVSFGLGDQEQK